MLVGVLVGVFVGVGVGVGGHRMSSRPCRAMTGMGLPATETKFSTITVSGVLTRHVGHGAACEDDFVEQSRPGEAAACHDVRMDRPRVGRHGAEAAVEQIAAEAATERLRCGRVVADG